MSANIDWRTVRNTVKEFRFCWEVIMSQKPSLSETFNQHISDEEQKLILETGIDLAERLYHPAESDEIAKKEAQEHIRAMEVFARVADEKAFLDDMRVYVTKEMRSPDFRRALIGTAPILAQVCSS